ncbi:hypothetical protein ElyMa_005503000 [Elysia marginata]|uniref:Uncharacterized protein n=1 Tax=Elysia marginata TaxID=1093978 RepID=A0AAV4EUC6_9GAST|nr:hypothetical protein ElyMa_005503000 [Elysia marginata]
MTSKPRKTFPNLRNGEKQALNELKKYKNITIKPADKGGAVVVLNTSDYIAECTKQLSNITHYQPLSANPTNKYNKIISKTLEQGIRGREITPEVAKALLAPHPTPGRFYILPKIHKEGKPWKTYYK